MNLQNHHIDKKQKFYSRLAGFLFLWLILTGLFGALTTSRIAGSGTFFEISKRVISSEPLYRVGLCSELIETMSAAVLAFALYVALKPVNKLLAQLGLYFRLGESFVGAAGLIFGFVRLGLYTSSSTTAESAQSQVLVDLTRDAGFATYNISALYFSIGSTFFFYLFYKSKYIPRLLSIIGLLASPIVTIICLGNLIFPDYQGTLQYGWSLMALAEVGTGIWLMLFGVRAPVTADLIE